MKTKPKALNYLALFFIAIAVGMPLQIMMLFGHTPLEPLAILTKLAPLNWAIMLFGPVVAWLVYRAHTLAIPGAVVLSYLVISNNWLVADVGINYSPLTAGFGSIGYLVVVSMLFTTSLREILLHPERRWWLTPRRRRVSLPVVVGSSGIEFITSTYDISETGAFLQVANHEELAPGRIFYVFLDLKNSRRIQARAQVVRVAEPNGQYPGGVGVRFLDMDREERALLSEFTNAA